MCTVNFIKKKTGYVKQEFCRQTNIIISGIQTNYGFVHNKGKHCEQREEMTAHIKIEQQKDTHTHTLYINFKLDYINQ